MLDEEAHAFLSRLDRRTQRKLERQFDLLRDRPFTEPSFVELGAAGEPLFHRLVDDWVVVYHVDHAARRVFILQILPNT